MQLHKSCQYSLTDSVCWNSIFFTDRLIYVAWSGGSTYTMLHVEPPLKKILYWSHSHWPLVMTSCAHGEEVLRQVVRQAVILTVSAVQKSCGCSGLVMTLIFKGSFQENWKVNFLKLNLNFLKLDRAASKWL